MRLSLPTKFRYNANGMNRKQFVIVEQVLDKERTPTTAEVTWMREKVEFTQVFGILIQTITEYAIRKPWQVWEDASRVVRLTKEAPSRNMIVYHQNEQLNIVQTTLTIRPSAEEEEGFTIQRQDSELTFALPDVSQTT